MLTRPRSSSVNNRLLNRGDKIYIIVPKVVKPVMAPQSGRYLADPLLLHWLNDCKGRREIESNYDSAGNISESSQTLLNDPRVSLGGPLKLNDRCRNSVQHCLRVKGWCLSLGWGLLKAAILSHVHTLTHTQTHTRCYFCLTTTTR